MNHQPEQESIGKWISTLYRYMQIYINKEFEQYKIGSGQFHVLLVLSRYDGINQESIAKTLHLDKATIARAVNKLIKVGYIKRAKDQKDHRAYILHLTKSGAQVVPKIRKSLAKLSMILLSDFSEKEKDLAFELLKKMYNNMTSMDTM